MTNLFSDQDVAVICELMQGALRQAADAFSRMANDTFEVQEMSLILDKPSHVFSHYTEAYLLTTEVKGEIQGKSYLLLNDQEAEAIMHKMKIKDPYCAGTLTAFQQAVLLELDNVLSAAAVSWLADQLEIFCYGDVPHLQKITRPEIDSFFASTQEPFWIIRSKLYSQKDQSSPSFIWLFEPEMILAVKKAYK